MVKLKIEDYYSKKYDTAMPYSIFFDLKERKAIHGGEVPSPAEEGVGRHGCVHVEMPYIERLFDWAEEGKTAVVIQGWRMKINCKLRTARPNCRWRAPA